MTTSSLFKEIDSLNKDIDNCKSRFDHNVAKRNACPPNCYCDKRKGMENRNVVTSTRKKTASATVTKMDLTPQCYQERDNSSKVKGNLRKDSSRPKTAIDDTCMHENKYVEYSCCPKSRVLNSQASEEKYSCNDNSIEPVKIPKKCSRVINEPSWSTVLQQNNRRSIKENIVHNFNPKKDEYTQIKSSSSSSAISSVTLETQPVYMKNRGIQCEERALPKDKFVCSNGPMNTIQYLIMNMKRKLKDDPSLGSMLDEMEVVLRRIPLDRGDNQTIDNIPRARRNSSIGKHIHPSPDFYQQQKMQASRDILEATYLELEATCAKLKKERDSAMEKASQKSVELVESMRREVETKTKLTETNGKIKEMSSKLETYTKSMEGLTEHVKRLQNENKDLERIRGQVTQLSCMMRDITQENKSLLAELQLVTIERNQLEVALAIKEQEVEKKTKELENLSQLLLEQSKVSRLSFEKNQKNQPLKKTVNSKESRKVQTPRNESHSPVLVASSPNSSSSDSVLRARLDSWIAFSTITSVEDAQDHLQQPLPSATINNNIPNTKDESIHVANISHPVQREASISEQKVQSLSKSDARPDLNKIEKLKEEIRRMFSEMRELAQDVPSIPVAEFSIVDDSSDINWSEMSNTVNSYESISELQSSEFNNFLSNH